VTRRALICFSLAALLLACGAAQAGEAREARPLADGAATQRALDDLGRRLYRGLAAGRPDAVVLREPELRALLTPAAAGRAVDVRHGAPGPQALTADERALWSSASYSGICVQQGRVEPADGAVGLRAPGFVFERALIIGREPDGGAIASWVEGRFVHTDAGFGALSLSSVERPRRDHADLELAVCELRAGPDKHKP
jgi:hypothetical protein